jgi:carbonic anhydrase/acetyltransferase-like protein (isoleucine patch superfamily)
MALSKYQQSSPRLGARVYVAPQATVIGAVTLGEDSSVWPGAVIRGDVQEITVGARTSVQDGAVLHVTHAGPFTGVGHALEVGAEVTIGHRAVLHGCRVGDRTLIGIGAIVLDGAVLEGELMIGAGALVPPGRRLEAGYLYLGQPARKARALTEQERAFLPYTAAQYVKLAAEYRAALRP